MNRQNVKTHLLVGMAMALVCTAAVAAPGDAIWMIHPGADFLAASDKQDGTVAAAYFYEPTDFGNGVITPLTFGDTAVVRYSSAGSLDWLVHLSPTDGGYGGVYAIEADSTGAVYLAGTLSFGSLDFGGGPLTAAGENCFLAKFDGTGQHVWSRLVGQLAPSALSVAGDRLAVIGDNQGTVDLGGSAMTSAGGNDICVGVLDLDGNHLWSAQFGDAQAQAVLGGGLDAAGNLTVAVAVDGEVDFGGGTLTATATDLGLASFDATGQHRWSSLFSGNFAAWPGFIGAACDVGADGRSVVTGWYTGTVDFGGGSLTGDDDGFVAAFDSDGSYLWSRAFPSDPAVNMYAASISGDGLVAVSGVFIGAVDFGGGDLIGQGDLVIACYGPSGNPLGSWDYGSPQYDDYIAIDFSSGGDLIAWGFTSAGADFGFGPTAEWGSFLGRITGPEAGTGGPTGVDGVPALVQAVSGYPNPFNPITNISYTVVQESEVSVAAYDLRGRLVQVLVPPRAQEPGEYSVRFQPESSGVYFVRVRAGATEQVVKMTAVK